MADIDAPVIDAVVDYITNFQRINKLTGDKKVNVSLDKIFFGADGIDYETIRRFNSLKALKLDLSLCCGIDFQKGRKGCELLISGASQFPDAIIEKYRRREIDSIKKQTAITVLPVVIVAAEVPVETATVPLKRKEYDHLSDRQKRRKLTNIRSAIKATTGYSDDTITIVAEDLLPRTKRKILMETTTTPSVADVTISTPEFDGPISTADIEAIKVPRTSFSKSEKSEVLKLLEDNRVVEEELASAVKQLNSTQRYERLRVSQVKEWRKEEASIKIKKKSGPKVNVAFESMVWSELVLCAFVDVRKENGTIEKLVKILHNVTYSYAIVREAAQRVHKQDEWLGDVGIQRLKFSNKWIRNFLKRRKVSKRGISREKKNLLPVEEVRRIMKENQDVILAGAYTARQVLNLDETAVNWGLGPTYVFAASDAERGEQEISDGKGRITGVPTVDATGHFLPTMYILKHSKSSSEKPDQTTMRVLRNLHKEIGYRECNGWKLKTWTRVLTMKNYRKVDVTAEHKTLYLHHEIDGKNKSMCTMKTGMTKS